MFGEDGSAIGVNLAEPDRFEPACFFETEREPPYAAEQIHNRQQVTRPSLP
jgi:hypothetical protein